MIRDWIISAVAGRKYAYWIRDSAQRNIAELSSVLGGGGAICIVKAMEKEDMEGAEFSIGDWVITVRKGNIDEADE